MKTIVSALLATAFLSGCGLAETGAAAATVATSEAEQAKQAKEQEAKFQQKLDEANKTAAEQRAKADQAD
jgi:hypothetical protein